MTYLGWLKPLSGITVERLSWISEEWRVLLIGGKWFNLGIAPVLPMRQHRIFERLIHVISSQAAGIAGPPIFRVS